MVSIKRVLVVGATGSTGKHVVQMLLDQGHHVRAIVRSQEKMKSLLQPSHDPERLFLTEGSILDMSSDSIHDHVKDCDAIVTCLGHNPTFAGIWGEPRRLVTESVQKMTQAMTAENTQKDTRFVLMGSEGVAHPDGKTDNPRAFGDGLLLKTLRMLLPPVRDNEAAAAYLYNHKEFPWVVVRPTNLVDEDKVSEYQILDGAKGALFGEEKVSRINVASFLTKLAVGEDADFDKYNHEFPVIHNR